MKARAILALAVLTVLSVRGDDPTTIDLFAGWSWAPYPYGYPYPFSHACRDGWGGGPRPYVGLSRTWPYADDPWPYRYGYGLGPYPYDWGLGYGVRMRVYPGSPRRFPEPDGSLLGPLPGTAPTMLRDETREKDWEPEIASFLATLPTAEARLAETNRPSAAR